MSLAILASWYFLPGASRRRHDSLARGLAPDATDSARREARAAAGETTVRAAQNEGRRKRAAESASALEAISQLAALAEKGLLSQAEFQRKKDELLRQV